MLRAPRGHDTGRRKFKICAVGEGTVGKTSLIRRFVADKFMADYAKTIGTELSKKTLELEGPEGHPVNVDAVIWDIMGQKGLVDLLQDAYFRGTKGVFAVCDITRKATLAKLHGWLMKVFSTVGIVPVVIMINKSDLTQQGRVEMEGVTKSTLQEFRLESGIQDTPYFLTSAKTGDNVSEAFEDLLMRILGGQETSSGSNEINSLELDFERVIRTLRD